MEWVETTGRTIEAARELALDQLGVDAAEAEFETLEEPKSGLFGRTRGVARVRARVSPKAPRPKAERRRRAPKRVDSGKGGESGERPDAAKRSTSGGGKSDSDQQGGRRKAASSPPAGTETSDAADDVPRETPTSRRGRGGSKDRNGSGDDRGGAREQMDIDEQISVLETFTSELATAMGLDAVASSQVEDNQLTVNLSGQGLGFLVGPRLATLDAVQEIARNTLQRQAAGREYAKVVVDVEGIRARRRTSLDGFVREAAEQVREDQVEVVFDVMSSPDRKQVHDLVTELDGVESVSEGEDPRRRVVLRPTN